MNNDQYTLYPEDAKQWLERISPKQAEAQGPSLLKDLEVADSSKLDSQGIARGALQGGKSGISGALMGGGLAAGLGSLGASGTAAAAGPWGWAALGAGALLSQMEKKAEAEALQEQENVRAEIQRKQNAQNAGNTLLATMNKIGSAQL